MATLQKTVNNISKGSLLLAIQKYCLLILFFSSTAHLPIQDVTGDAQTHFSAAPLKTLGSCVFLLHAQNVHNRTQSPHKGQHQKCVWASSHLFLKKDGLGQRAKQGKGEKKCPHTSSFFLLFTWATAGKFFGCIPLHIIIHYYS